MSKNLPNNKTFSHPNGLYKIGEISDILGVSIGTIRRWERNGKLKSVRTIGGHRRYSFEDIKIAGAKRDLRSISAQRGRNQKKEILIPPSHPLSVRSTPILPSIHTTPLYTIPPFGFPLKKLFNIGLRGSIIFLLLFFVSKANLIGLAINSIPPEIRSEIVQVTEKYGITKFLNEKAAQIEEIASSIKQNFNFEESSLEIKNNQPPVLAESISKDTTFDVNIDARFKGNLLTEGNTTVSGTLTANNFTTTGNITGQSVTSNGAITGGTGVFTGNITVPGIVTNATTINLVNTNATTINLGGAGTTISIGATSGTTTVNNDLKVSGTLTSSGKITASGDLTVSGTLTASGALNVSGATALSGNLTKINGVTYSWPTTQGAASTSLTNNGSGTLSWAAASVDLSSATGVLGIANGGTNNSTAYTAGSVIFSDGTKLTQDNTNFFWNDTDNILRIGSGAKITPSVDLGSDLGTASLRWNNIYAANLTIDSGLSSGQLLVTYNPTDTTFAQASIRINVTTPAADEQMLGIGQAGEERAAIDAEGDLTIGYDGIAGSSIPANSNPLAIYNHGTTELMRVQTNGNVGIGTTPSSRLHVKGGSSIAVAGTSNLLTADGTFAATTGWSTFGSGGWTHDSVNQEADHTGTGDLSGTSTATSTSTVYQINFTVSNYTSGSLTVSLGGQDSGNFYNSNGAKTTYIKPSAGTGTLTFSGTWDGTVDSVTIYAITPSTADLQLENSDGTGSILQLRAGGTSLLNTFVGQDVGKNTVGQGNSGFGYQALMNNATGNYNTAIGYFTLKSNIEGFSNTAVGFNAFNANISGDYNTAVGEEALRSATATTYNTSFGSRSSYNITTGGQNTAIGFSSLLNNQTGSGNVALGIYAGYGASLNSFNNATLAGGYSGFSLTTGGNNVFLGYKAGEAATTATNNIVIGYDIDLPAVSSSNMLDIGNLIYATGLDGSNTTLSTGNVGIGTSSPTSKFHLTGAVTGKALAIFDETGDQALFTASSSGTTKFVIDHTGQVGIGLAPNSPLDVAIQFPYQKAVTISYTGATLTNYAILVNTDTSTPISQSKLQSSCQDLRFTDSDNVTQLGYYIESGCNTTTTQIWVQVPSIPNGGKTIYMHYGNSNALAGTRTLPAQNFIAPFNTTCPSGWSSVTGINGSNRFVRGNTAAGATGGSTTVTHTVSGTTGGPSGTANQDTGGSASNAATSTHTHALGSTTTSTPSNGSPPYVDVVYCSFNGSIIPNTVPTSFIGMFDTVPSGWTRDATYDTNFLRGNATAGGTGGSATHTHTVTGTTGGPSASVSNNTGADVRPNNAHTHTFTSAATDAASSLPSYRDMLMAKPNATSSLAPGLVIAFDASNTPPLGWTQYTNLNGKFPRGNTTSAGTGGADTHSHTYTLVSGVESASAAAGGGVGGTVTGKAHTHTLTGTSSTDSSLPPYIEQVYFQRNTDATTNSVGSETTTTGPERELVVSSTGYTGIGQTSPLWRLQVSDYREASASALIENTANLSNFNPTGMIIRLGNDSTNPDTGDRFINFMRGDSTVVGKIQGNGGTGSVNYATAGTDFAEYFKKDNLQEILEPGDAMCIGTDGVTKCLPQNSNKVVGVVSNQAGFTGGMQHEDDPGYVIVGLSGQLNLKIASSSADIKTGDLLTASTEAGKATKAIIKGGYYIAKALEDWSAGLGKDKVRVLIQSGYYDSPFLTLDGTGNVLSDSNLAQSSVSGLSIVATNSASLATLELPTNLNNIIASMSAQIANLESDVQILKSTQLVATASSNILGTATDSAQLTNLSVLKNTILGDTVINGKLNIGTIIIDNINNSIDTIGILKIQALALDSIQFEGGAIEMDKDGNLKINKGVVIGNDQMRGAVILSANQNIVDIIPTIPWSNPPKSIVITPSFITSFAVTRLEKTGATVHFGQTSGQDQKIYWVAIW